QAHILFLHLSQLADLVYFQPHIVLLPAIECLFRDPRLANQLRHWNTHLGLLQDGHDLLHRITLPFHGKSPFFESFILPETHSPTGSKIPGPPSRIFEKICRRELVNADTLREYEGTIRTQLRQ